MERKLLFFASFFFFIYRGFFLVCGGAEKRRKENRKTDQKKQAQAHTSADTERIRVGIKVVSLNKERGVKEKHNNL